MRTITCTDGAKLRLRDWPQPAGVARGLVLIVHGVGEHIGRYSHVAEHLVEQGWAVAGHDQRGHGQSDGARGALPVDSCLLTDLTSVIDALRHDHAGPLVLLGHSLGGVVASRFVAEGWSDAPAHWWRPVDALVLSSPALDPGMGAAQKLLLALLGPLAPNLALGNGLNPDFISRDAAVVAAYRADPLVHDRITPRLVRFIVDGGEFVRLAARRWSLPTLLMYAGADRLVAPAGSAAFAATAPREWVQVQEYPALFHEIFNEPERDQVLVALSTWLAARQSVRLA